MFKFFLTFFKVGLFTFGGGYAMVPIMETELVKKEQLLSSEEFVDYISVAQSFPGPIAVNLSVLMGYRIHGLIGAILSLLGTVLPSFIIILFISLFYSKTRNSKILDGFFSGIIPVVPALLAFSFINIFQKSNKKASSIVLIAMTFLAVAFLDVNPLFIILGGVLLGICKYYCHSS